MLSVRFYVRPERPEAPGRIFDDLEQGRIGSFHVFKWRLAMALHRGLEEGARVADVWKAWSERVPDAGALARRTGWPMEVIRTMDAYRDVPATYTFPTLEEARATLSGAFDEIDCRFPTYELGERCPTLSFWPR